MKGFTWPSHIASVVPSEFDSISTGARSGPSTSTWIGQPSASITGMGFLALIRGSGSLDAAERRRTDDAVDEGLGDALVEHRIEQLGQFRAG